VLLVKSERQNFEDVFIRQSRLAHFEASDKALVGEYYGLMG
jgi:hypothetical protein